LGRLTREGTFEFIISTFVLDELLRNIEEDGIVYTQEHLQAFLEQTGLILLPSQIKDLVYAEYVNDMNDRQVLQDAVQMNAQYILTHNLKDFDRDAIYKAFGIRVINDLMYIM
jgi:predicted nucleic acid-binding protein